MPPDWRARALIDIGALRRNLDAVREKAAGCAVMAVLKADAYGHGIDAVCRAVRGRVDAIAVATMDEALACRAICDELHICVLSPGIERDWLALCARMRLTPVLHDFAQLQAAQQYAGAALEVWLKVDSGMNRLGIAFDDAQTAFTQLARNAQINIVGVMSHLANAEVRNVNATVDATGAVVGNAINDETCNVTCDAIDDATDDVTYDVTNDITRIQTERFLHSTAHCNRPRSLANSAAVCAHPSTHLDWVRPGLMLYGASPFADVDARALGLSAVMKLQTRLLAVKQIARGARVGYGGAFVARKAMRIGVAGLGYADGYPRLPGVDAFTLVRGKRAPIVGRVSMDMMTLDVSKCGAVEVGDVVDVWGDDATLNVEQVAAAGGMIAHELLCRVGARVGRVYLDS